MDYYLLEFDGVTCAGCITAVEEKLKNLEESKLKKTDKTSGNSIIKSTLGKDRFQKAWIHLKVVAPPVRSVLRRSKQ